MSLRLRRRDNPRKTSYGVRVTAGQAEDLITAQATSSQKTGSPWTKAGSRQAIRDRLQGQRKEKLAASQARSLLLLATRGSCKMQASSISEISWKGVHTSMSPFCVLRTPKLNVRDEAELGPPTGVSAVPARSYGVNPVVTRDANRLASSSGIMTSGESARAYDHRLEKASGCQANGAPHEREGSVFRFEK